MSEDEGETVDWESIIRAKLLQARPVAERAPVDLSPKARAKRHKAATKASDGRAARATGRDKIGHYRMRQDLIEAVRRAAKAGGEPIAAWMERAVEAALGRAGDG